LFVLGAFWPAVYGLTFLQDHLALSATWFLSCLAMSSFTLLPAMKTENVTLILVGGGLMVIVGLLYLLFEDFVLADFSSARKPSTQPSTLNRTLVGIQIGLTVLAMFITRSSALSLQAKQGLPLGNQVMGWAVLGKSSFIFFIELY
jgi:phosphatidylinositol glycan class N